MRADRLIGILFKLDKRKKVTARELAGKFEVSVRTIYRDIDILSLEFPLRAEAGPEGGYSLMPGYKLPPLPFSRKDALALTLMGSVAAQKLGLIEGKSFNNAYRKLLARLREISGGEMNDLSDRILIDIEPWKSPPGIPRVMKKIKTALAENKIIAFEYKKAAGKIESQEVNPYGLCYRSGFFYLVGFSRKRNCIRIFRTDRFSKLVVTDETFKQDPKFNLNKFWTKELPEDYEKKGKEVKIIFDKSVASDIKKTKWGAGKTRELKDGKLELTFKTFDTKRLVSFVLSFGSKAELIEPAHIRRRIFSEARAIQRTYTDSLNREALNNSRTAGISQPGSMVPGN